MLLVRLIGCYLFIPAAGSSCSLADPRTTNHFCRSVSDAVLKYMYISPLIITSIRRLSLGWAVGGAE